MDIQDFNKISPFRWRLEKDSHKKLKMKADAEVFATEEILQAALDDNSIQQVINVSCLPGLASRSIAMPDIHYGYGFSIGGVAAFDAENGIVLPGGVGYDINCGVRLLSTAIPVKEAEKTKDALGYAILEKIPTGMTKHSNLKLKKKDFLKVLKKGAVQVANRYTKHSGDEWLHLIESSGRLEFHMPEILSDRSIERGLSQLGSLGGGNHFIEIQQVDEIYDQEAATVMGLQKGHIAIMIHTGSRGFGHQVASDYIERIRKRNLKNIKVKDPQLVYASIQSNEGKHYLQALNAASNFAWANRQLIMDQLIGIFETLFKSSSENLGMGLVYDQAHNIAKFENHHDRDILVHRKGATRAFGPGHPEIPAQYKHIGQPVLIPGSMGTASYVMKGTDEAMDATLGSSAHGAGRRLSRHKAIKFAANMNVRETLKQKNILAFSNSERGLKEEIPEAYKEIDDVVEVTEGAGISQKVARLLPVAVIKG